VARVKTFRIHPTFGVPDKDITEFLTECEQEAIIQVKVIWIPGSFEENAVNPKLTVIAYKLDELPTRPE
jgi:hypothetical protein